MRLNFNVRYVVRCLFVVFIFISCDVINLQVRGGFAISRVPQVITSRPVPADQEQAQGGIKALQLAEEQQKSKEEIDTLLPTNQVSELHPGHDLFCRRN